MNKKQQKLTEVAQQIIDNKVCPELATQATQLVPGDGNPDADIVMIGEAPGKNEDLKGIPFVGAAGKLLDEMLESIGLERTDIFITNIVKYRPPGNRDPSDEEKTAFLPYLDQQLAIIEPKLIVTLGRHAMNSFLPSLKISAVHGQPKRIKMNIFHPGNAHAEVQDGLRLESSARNQQVAQEDVQEALRLSSAADDAANDQEREQSDEHRSSAGSSDRMVILPLYHPAAALYNGGMRQTLFDDFAKIPTILKLIDNDTNNNQKPTIPEQANLL